MKTSRMDIIGQNGNTAEHYTYLPPCYGEYGYYNYQTGSVCKSCGWRGDCQASVGHSEPLEKLVGHA